MSFFRKEGISNSKIMQKYEIRGVTVEFPHTAYDCQLLYMERVIEALQTQKLALLESPTGTGKTLCLLCASLGNPIHFVRESS